MDPANFQEKKPISMMLTQFISSIIYVKKNKKKKNYQHNILLVHKVDQVDMVLEFQLNIIGPSFHKWTLLIIYTSWNKQFRI